MELLQAIWAMRPFRLLWWLLMHPAWVKEYQTASDGEKLAIADYYLTYGELPMHWRTERFG